MLYLINICTGNEKPSTKVNLASYLLFSIVDVNECALAYSVCEHGGQCINLAGNFTCNCPAGWTGHGCRIGLYRDLVDSIWYNK